MFLEGFTGFPERFYLFFRKVYWFSRQFYLFLEGFTGFPERFYLFFRTVCWFSRQFYLFCRRVYWFS